MPDPRLRTPDARPRVLSGIRPTGSGFHLGNHLGAVRHWAAMQDEAECFFFLADLHALTELPDPQELRARTRGSAAELLALGVDPERSVVFAQSHLPEHATLLASSPGCPVQAFRVGSNVYATQFHPELDIAGLVTRIEVYKHSGYFEPHEADSYKAMARASTVLEPPKILTRFVQRYARA